MRILTSSGKIYLDYIIGKVAEEKEARYQTNFILSLDFWVNSVIVLQENEMSGP